MKKEYMIQDHDRNVTRVIADTVDATDDFVFFYASGQAGLVAMFSVSSVNSVTSVDYAANVDDVLNPNGIVRRSVKDI